MSLVTQSTVKSRESTVNRLPIIANRLSGVRCQVSGVRGEVSGIRCQGPGGRGVGCLVSVELRHAASISRPVLSQTRSRTVERLAAPGTWNLTPGTYLLSGQDRLVVGEGVHVRKTGHAGRQLVDILKIGV